MSSRIRSSTDLLKRRTTTGSSIWSSNAFPEEKGVVIIDGYMSIANAKKSGTHKKFQDRWFRLYANNSLCYYADAASVSGKALGEISLYEVMIVEEDGAHQFHLVTLKRTYTLKCSVTDELEEWLKNIKLRVSPTIFCSGWLFKKGEKNRNWKLRFFVLCEYEHTCEVRYYEDEQRTKLKGCIPLLLGSCKINILANTSIQQYGKDLVLELVTAHRTYVVAAQQTKERNMWYKEIKKVLSGAHHDQSRPPAPTLSSNDTKQELINTLFDETSRHENVADDTQTAQHESRELQAQKVKSNMSVSSSTSWASSASLPMTTDNVAMGKPSIPSAAQEAAHMYGGRKSKAHEGSVHNTVSSKKSSPSPYLRMKSSEPFFDSSAHVIAKPMRSNQSIATTTKDHRPSLVADLFGLYDVEMDAESAKEKEKANEDDEPLFMNMEVHDDDGMTAAGNNSNDNKSKDMEMHGLGNGNANAPDFIMNSTAGQAHPVDRSYSQTSSHFTNNFLSSNYSGADYGPLVDAGDSTQTTGKSRSQTCCVKCSIL